MTGFRVAYGGAQELYGVTPDMTSSARSSAAACRGGLRRSARHDSLVAPAGPVYQAGTLSGNPLAMAAGIAQLEMLRESGTYERLESLSAQLAEGVSGGARGWCTDRSDAGRRDVHRLLRGLALSSTRPRQSARTPQRMRPTSRRCLKRASTSLPHSSRLDSCRWRIATTISLIPSTPRAPPSPPSRVVQSKRLALSESASTYARYDLPSHGRLRATERFPSDITSQHTGR